VGNKRILYMIVALWNKRRDCVIDVFYRLYICICVWYTFMFYLLPYLLVFGDDRVRGTHEQVMSQVKLVRLSCGEGIIMGSLYLCFLYFI